MNVTLTDEGYTPDGKAIAVAPPIGPDGATGKPDRGAAGKPVRGAEHPAAGDAREAAAGGAYEVAADGACEVATAGTREVAAGGPRNAALDRALDRTTTIPLDGARALRPDLHAPPPPYARDSLIPWHIEAAAWEAVDQP